MIMGLTNYSKSLVVEDERVPEKLIKKIRKDTKDLHRQMLETNYQELLGFDSKLPDEKSNIVQLIKY